MPNVDLEKTYVLISFLPFVVAAVFPPQNMEGFFFFFFSREQASTFLFA